MHSPFLNWRAPCEYKYLLEDDVQGNQFAWEFMKRSNLYIEGYARFLDLLKQDQIEHGHDPEQDPYKPIEGGPSEAFGKKMCMEFGIISSTPPSPGQEDAPMFAGIPIMTHGQCTDYKPEALMRKITDHMIPKAPCEILIKLDLDIPLQTQLEWLESTLPALVDNVIGKHIAKIDHDCRIKTRTEANKRRRDRTQLITYLRLLDALQGMNQSNKADLQREIIQALFGDKANEYPEYQGRRAMETAIKAARKLTQDCRWLVFSPVSKRKGKGVGAKNGT